MMLAFLIIVTLFSFWGTLKNKQMRNTFGTVVSGLFSVVLAAITILAALFAMGVLSL